MRIACGLLLGGLALACRGPARTSPGGPAHPTLGVDPGDWHGTRRAADDGSVEPMTLSVHPLLGGAAFLEELEVRGASTYRGIHVLLLDRERECWVRHYANAEHGRFTQLEGTVEQGRTVWRNTTPGRTRESRLVEECPAPGHLRRVQEISSDGGTTWRVLFTDELERIGSR